MKIGLDVRALSGQYTGDHTYWSGLIEALSAIDSENTYYLYSRTEANYCKDLQLKPNFHWRVVSSINNDAVWFHSALPRALAHDGVNILHTQYNIPFANITCPIISTIHDISFALFPELFQAKDRWILNHFIPRSLARAVHVITNSECTRRDILRIYKSQVSSDKVTSIPLSANKRFVPHSMGQESARSMVNKMLNLSDIPYILSIGAIESRTILNVLIDAFALMKLGPLAPPHRLIVAGKRGWMNSKVDRQVSLLPSSIQEDIIWTDYLDDEFMPVLYAGAEMLCYMSRYEGFGLRPLEGMACQCPVLCSRTSSMSEVVGDAGLLLPHDDSEPWAHAMEKLVSEPEIRRLWGQRGLNRSHNFSWEHTAKQTLKLYFDCAN